MYIEDITFGKSVVGKQSLKKNKYKYLIIIHISLYGINTISGTYNKNKLDIKTKTIVLAIELLMHLQSYFF